MYNYNREKINQLKNGVYGIIDHYDHLRGAKRDWIDDIHNLIYAVGTNIENEIERIPL